MVAVLEELVNSLYDMIQEARSVPLSAEKCMIDREKALDILDEIRTNMPKDLEMARAIVEKRNDMVAAGKKDAEELRRKAEEYVRKTVNESSMVAAAQQQADEIVSTAEKQAAQLRNAVSSYCNEKLDATEACAAATLEEIRKCRAQFDTVNQK
ncbi:hypothetical protein [Butyricicoccus sp.]|uniref:hypothetical protein n=1 Tax=Butyricicoccus sp. TaxID=2049021 RepID=UPI002A8A4C77|nr:hypothetical protein [Butyricicoccus sp.]